MGVLEVNRPNREGRQVQQPRGDKRVTYRGQPMPRSLGEATCTEKDINESNELDEIRHRDAENRRYLDDK